MTVSSFWDERIETLPRDVLRQVQLGRLQWQIRRCWDSSEFYRERLQQVGLEPDAIQSLEDLRGVPLLTFEQLAEERRRHPPFGRSAIASGTTWRELQLVAQGPGDSIVVIASEADLENGAGLVARALWSMGVRTDDVVQSALPSGESTLARLVQGAADRIGCLIVSTSAAGPDRQVESLRRLEPSTLLATPTDAYAILGAPRQRGTTAGHGLARVGLFGAEALPGRGLDPGGDVSEIATYACYGRADIGPLCASECEFRRGLHWAEDHFVVEILDPTTREPSAEGEAGVLVVSQISREATPLLRFWTGDYGRLVGEPCGCGRTHARSM